MDDLLKQRLQCGVVGFNLTLMIYMLAKMLQGVQLSWGWYLSQAGIGAGLGLLVAAVIYFVVGRLQK